VYNALQTKLRARRGSQRKELQQRLDDLAEVYWWLQVVALRTEGRLPAWEGIRLVREPR